MGFRQQDYLFIRMCRALMPGDEERMTDEAIWEALPVSSLDLVIYNMRVKISQIYPMFIKCFNDKQKG